MVAGLTYVALSTVRKLSDIVIEPLTFERLHAGRIQVRTIGTTYIAKTHKRKNVTFFMHLLQ